MGKSRYVCIDCNRKRGGGYFSASQASEIRCPYCGSIKVKRLH